VSNIQLDDGSPASSVVLDDADDWLLLEAWTTTDWRIKRGTATVS
jgi:hypothetical protein